MAEVNVAEVIPLRKAVVESKASEKKWSKPVCDLGFSVIPSLIFRAQARLGLNPTQLAILLQLADYWWDSDRHPYPSKATLAERMGLSPRQVQRYIAELEKAGLVTRKPRFAAHKGRLANQYELTGLVNRLKSLEPEFREAAEATRQVSRRGGIAKQSK